MKMIRNLFLIGVCLATIDVAPLNNIRMVKNAISHGLQQIFATIQIVHLRRISTNKIIWQDKIGQHHVSVFHANGFPYKSLLTEAFFCFYLNTVSDTQALELWNNNLPSFQRILPLINNTKDIEIRMCTPSSWAIGEAENQYILWVSNQIQTDTKEETEFKIAHEAAHAILKHTLSRAKTYKERHTREMQADLRAAKINGTARGGIDSFYKRANNPILRLDRALSDKIFGPSTHPLDRKRVEYLQKWQNRHHPPTTKTVFLETTKSRKSHPEINA